ncbi:MAG: hypothetical protein B7X06_03970, partial [Verrucomicrobia bacterium 21-51-4]
MDIYVSPKNEDIGHLADQIEHIIKKNPLSDDLRVEMRGSAGAMRESFKSFGLGLILSVILVYLVLVAQFKSFVDPFVILLAIPPGVIGTIFILLLTDTPLSIMAFMGTVMLIGVSVSDSILIVEFIHRLRSTGVELYDAIKSACRIRLRPIIMTSLATIVGLIPMAFALGAGSEAY